MSDEGDTVCRLDPNAPICKVCAASVKNDVVEYVWSPSGLRHVTEDDGVTCCGRDATCDGWLWLL